MLKEAGGLVGGALILSPLGAPILLHGLAGIIVGGAGLFVADAVVKQTVETVSNFVSQPKPEQSEEATDL